MDIPSLNMPIEVDQKLAAGSNKLDLFNMLSMLGPDGVPLSILRTYLGSAANFTGTMTDTAGNISNVSLKLNL